MDRTTLLALNEINRRFYKIRACEFSQTRQAPWPGWQRVVSSLRKQWDPDSPLRVLDLGCGNGRLLRFLAPQFMGGLDYWGLDVVLPPASERDRPNAATGGIHWLTHDMLAAAGTDPVPEEVEGCFDLIALFGVLHHVPGFSTRRALLAQLSARLSPRGLLALSLWQFGTRERFTRRLVPWSACEAMTGVAVDAERLEPRDCLLAWGSDRSTVRYCHHVTTEEWEELIRGLPLECVDRYAADGEDGSMNEYRLVVR
jgi:SAM-dependent methyltransferase